VAYPVAGGAEGIAVADVNGDGKLDLLASVYYGNGGPDAAVLLGNGDGTFPSAQLYGSGDHFLGNSIAVADVDRDGKLDLLVSFYCVDHSGNSCAKAGVALLRGNGDGTFQPEELYRTGGDFSSEVIAADVNGDSRPDLIVANQCFNLLGNPGGCGATGWVTVAVNKSISATDTALISNLNPSIYGQSVTLTASVTTVGPLTPTGSVIFKNGSSQIGSATLTDGTAMLTTHVLPVGKLSLAAIYHGDVQSAGSTSTLLMQTVQAAATTTVLTSSRNPAPHGKSVTFTAKVSSATVVPTGTVTFSDGGTVLATVNLAAGKAIYSTSSLATGSHSLTAVYSGNANITGSTSPTLMQGID
jgi:hypothetical protein